MATENSLRELLASERRRRRVTQAAAARAAGRTRKWLSDYERGVSDPSVGSVLRLAAALGVRVAFEADPGPFGPLAPGVAAVQGPPDGPDAGGDERESGLDAP